MSKIYFVYFGDIYMSYLCLLLMFDVVMLFYLCEFCDEVNSCYGVKIDEEVFDLFVCYIVFNGYLLFYMGLLVY